MTPTAATNQSSDVFPENAVLIRIMLLFLGCLIESLYSIYFLRQPNSAAFIWYTNGFSIAMIALAPSSQRLALVGTAFVAILLSNIIFGDDPLQSIQLAAANSSTIILGSLSLAYIARYAEPFLSMKAFTSFVLLTVLLSPLAGAVLGGWVLNRELSIPFEAVAPAWYLGDVIGILAITPLVYTLLQSNRELPSSLCRPTTVMTIFVIAALCGWLLTHATFPFIAIAIALTVAGAILDRLSAFFTAFVVSVTLDLLLVNPEENLVISTEPVSTTGLLLPISGAMLLGAILAVKSARLLQIQKTSDERADLFSNAMQSSVIGTVMVQPDGTMSNANKSFIDLIGYTAKELEKKTFRQLVFHRDKDAANEQLQLLSSGKINNFQTEVRLTRKNKQVVWTRIGVSIIRDKWTGNTLQFIYQVQDIDKDRRFDDERKMWSKKFEFALGINRTAVYEMECHTKYLHLSENASQAIGIKASDVKRLYEWMSRIHPDDLREYQHTVTYNGGQFGAIEYRLLDDNERYRWVRDHCQPIEHDSHGVTTKVIGTITDIDDERELSLQEALAAKQAELVGQVCDFGLWEYNPETEEIYWNTEMYALYGLQESDGISRSLWRDKVLPSDQHQLEAMFTVARMHDEQLDINIQVRNANGQVVYHHILARVIHPDSGSRLVGLCQETTTIHRENVQLERENLLLATAAESVSDGIIALDSLLRITFINRHAAAFTGLSNNDLIGASIDEQFNIFDRQNQYTFAHLLSAYHQDFRLNGTFTLQTEQHQEQLVYLEVIPVIPDGNAPNGWVLTFHLHTVSMEERIAGKEEKSALDMLTKLPNRRAFEHKLQGHIDSLEESLDRHTLAVVEIGGLEALADAFGNQIRDQLVKSAGLIIKSFGKQNAARLSDKQFGVLLPNESIENAQHSLNKLSEKICSLKYQHGETSYPLDCSIGLTAAEALQSTPFQLIYQAQVALESLTESCKPAISVFDPSLLNDGISFRRDFLLQRIDTAISTNSFSLLSMPLVPNSQELPTWHEVLVRLITEEGDLLLPAEFLPAAEPTGRLISIERWVFNEVLVEQANALAETGLGIAVNISTGAFYSESFMSYCLGLIKDSVLPASQICIEVKESTLLIDTIRSQDIVSSLRKLGCEVAVDNFGSELSSFGYLRKFNISLIKIDGSIISMMKSSKVDKRIVESIKQVADTLKVKTSAHKVNSEEDLRHVREVGLDYTQGYVYGEPIPLGRVISSSKAGIRNPYEKDAASNRKSAG
ncbi:putative diguanylate cyclase YegE [Grimontia celer]|uniref:Putative diguanylate cyclase YegE n=1 Tax=Grimontia celer TaxID=1796497 RepID=A0A128F299_9GAMM|nr:EAL domain-containing protein [Grimontia celer]CZF80918.1 putative diguanylate cyclase YegE [Grimontia celer]